MASSGAVKDQAAKVRRLRYGSHPLPGSQNVSAMLCKKQEAEVKCGGCGGRGGAVQECGMWASRNILVTGVMAVAVCCSQRNNAATPTKESLAITTYKQYTYAARLDRVNKYWSEER